MYYYQLLKKSIPLFFLCSLFFLSAGVFHVEAEERLAVSSAIANIRSEPSKKGDILWKVEQYYPLIVLEKKGRWYRFRDFEGDEGWIHNSIVKKSPTVITIKNKCNVRAKASTKGKVIFTTEKGIPFKVIKKKGNWIFVEHSDGDRGWIHKSLVW